MTIKHFINLAPFLRAKRLKAGITQGELAAALGYTSPQFVSNWERGASRPPMDSLLSIMQILKIPKKEFLELLLDENRRYLEDMLSSDVRRRRRRAG